MAEFQSGMPRQLRDYWLHGEGAARIRWGTDGSFTRCTRLLAAEAAEDGNTIADVKGTCANLYHEATGEWPGSHRRKGEHNAAELEALVAAMGSYKRIPWSGPLAPIGSATGDGRMFPPGVLTFADVPMPLRWQEKGTRGHDGAVTVAVIEKISEGVDGEGRPAIIGSGYFLNPDVIPEVNKALHQLEHGVVGPSVDLDSYTARLIEFAGQPVQAVSRGRVRAATLVAVPAFANLRLKFGDVSPFALEPETFAVNGSGWRGAPTAPREALFDADDAIARIEQWAGIGTEAADPAKMAKMFLWNDPNGAPLDRRGYRLPWGDIIDGKPYLIYHAIYAAAALLEGAHGGLPNIPDGDKTKLRGVISEIYDHLSAEFEDPQVQAPWGPGPGTSATADLEDVEEFDYEGACLCEECAEEAFSFWCDECSEFAVDVDEWDAQVEAFLGKYTESKHPRHRKGSGDKSGEWRDVPGHGPHGQILVNGKWKYPPRNKNHQPKHAKPESEGRHRAADDEGESKQKKSYRAKHKGPYRYHGKRRAEDRKEKKAETPEKKTEVKAPEKKAQEKKAPEKKPEVKEPEKKPEVPGKKAGEKVPKRAGEPARATKLSQSQQVTLQALRDRGGSVNLEETTPKGLSKASLPALEKKGLISRDNMRITLTEDGWKLAERSTFNVDTTVKAIKAAKTSEELNAIVGKLSKPELLAVAKEQGNRVTTRHTVADLRLIVAQEMESELRLRAKREEAQKKVATEKAESEKTQELERKAAGEADPRLPKMLTGDMGHNWWTKLPVDTPDGGIPVRDLQVDSGYTVKSGRVYRKDGISYLVESGTTLNDNHRVAMMGLEKFHQTLPTDAAEYQKAYAWLKGSSPHDQYWQQRFKNPNHAALASAGDGLTRVWKRTAADAPNQITDALNHEFGHNVSNAVAQRGLDADSGSWKSSALNDYQEARRIPGISPTSAASRLGFEVAVDNNRDYPYGVTRYGKSSPGEDYAESTALYLMGVVGHVMRGGQRMPVYFRDLFPGRTAVLDQVYPKFAKKQKKEVSDRGSIPEL